ncbi:MAG: hypothetical protein JEZ14_22840 [Marinilabiliaceae bacterium]|nr:hypothetical protein [Marinilabiliaceae bacterium]
MAYSKVIIVLVLTYLLFACSSSIKDEHKEIVESWLGKEIVLLSLDQKGKSFGKDSVCKIVTRINGNCFPCLEDFKLWNPLITRLGAKYELPVYIYVVTADSSKVQTILQSEMDFNHSVIYDLNDEFYKQNKLSKNSLYHTMLLNELNEVVLVGNPTRNNKLIELYLKEIENRWRLKNNVEKN